MSMYLSKNQMCYAMRFVKLLAVFVCTNLLVSCVGVPPRVDFSERQPDILQTSDIPTGTFLLEDNDLGIEITPSKSLIVVHFIHSTAEIIDQALVVDSDTLFPNLSSLCLETDVLICASAAQCRPCISKIQSVTSYHGYQSLIFKRNGQLLFGLLSNEAPFITFWVLPSGDEVGIPQVSLKRSELNSTEKTIF